MIERSNILDINGVDIQPGDRVYWNADREIEYHVAGFNISRYRVYVRIVRRDAMYHSPGAVIETHASNLEVIIEDPVRFIESMPI